MRKKFTPFLMLCIMGGFAIFSSTMAKNPALPLFIRSLGVPVSTVGFIAAASTVVGIVVSIPAGVLSDIIGRRRVMLIAAAVFATAPFLYLLVSLPWQLVLVRIYHGLATAILGPVAMATVADTFEKGRGGRLGWYSSATMVGRFLAPIVGGALIFGDNFRWVYIADGFAGIVALLIAFRLPVSAAAAAPAGEVLKRQGGKIGQEIKLIFRHSAILATSSIQAALYFVFGSLETFLPIYLKEQMGISTLEIGFLFTVQVLAAALTIPLMGYLSDRYGRVRMITFGLALGGVMTAVITYSRSYFLLAVLIGLFGLGLATVTSSTSALIADLTQSYNRGSALGIFSSIMDVGQSAGPIVSGLLIGAYSYRLAFGIVGAGLVIIGLVFGLTMRRPAAQATAGG